jgi:hypothetical protein
VIDRSAGAWFLAILAVHVASAAAALAAGAIAALAGKHPGRHPAAGTVYHRCLAVTVVSLTALSVLHWPRDTHLLAIGAVSYLAATIAIRAHRLRWHGWPTWPRLHGTGMTVSYVALLTGFYVDNGPHLPLWKHLPHLAYWLLPSAVGTLLLLRALRRHTVRVHGRDPRPARHHPPV